MGEYWIVDNHDALIGAGNAAGFGRKDYSKKKKAKLVPIEFFDSKDTTLDNGNDVSITPKKDANDKSLSSVAWIAPHGAANGKDPAMPYLVLRCPGTDQMNLKIKWKLKVEYKRPSGRTLTEDTVTIQSGGQTWAPETFNGALKFYDNADWKTAIGNQSDALQAGRGFFGGEATLTWQLMKADGSSLIDEQTILFRIAGKNPKDDLCRQYIDKMANDLTSQAGSLMWYAYAIAKSETKDEGGEQYYNQFLKRGDKYKDKKGSEGVPDWNEDDVGEPGGYGIKQVTGYKGDDSANVPRSVIWNWEHNVDEGMRELVNVNKEARSWMTRQRSQATKSLTAHQVLSVTFNDGTTRTMEDAVAIKRYNGASKRDAPDSYTDPAGGFTFSNETPRSGYYCYWDNLRNKWSISRWNNPPPPTKPFVYINRVCQEVDP